MFDRRPKSLKILLRMLAMSVLLLAGNTLHAEQQHNLIQALGSAQAALDKKDYATAYALYLRQAKRQNGLAQFVLGLFYQEGWGRSKNPAMACSWFEKAAHNKIPTAENNWADCLAQGIARAADIPAALPWYETAAGHGDLIAACTAADYYIQGKGVPQDVPRGIALCTPVAQHSSVPAMLKLARYYEQGKYLAQDLPQARYWYVQAAELNDAEAQYHAGVMLAQGDGGAPDREAALFWLETAASAGYAPAYLPTAVLYAHQPVQPANGALAPEDLAKVYVWNGAAKARVSDPAQRVVMAQLDAQLATAMPASWRASLDQKIAAHLAQYPLSSNSIASPDDVNEHLPP
jgi:TPR repeat protein